MLPDGVKDLIISEGVAKDVPEDLRYLFSQPFHPSTQCMTNMLSMEKLFQVLEASGYDTREGVAICLEPESERLKKIAEGKFDELWCMFLYRHAVYGIPMMEIKREKGDLYRIFMCWNIPKKYCFPLVQEAPEKPGKAGHFIIRRYRDMFMVTIDLDALGRPHPVLFGGNVTSAGEVPTDSELKGFYFTNYQRIFPDKSVLVFIEDLKMCPIISNTHIKEKEPPGGWNYDNLPVGFILLMHYEDLIELSHDARTLAAVAIHLATHFGERRDKLMSTLSNLAKYNEMPVEETAICSGLSKKEQAQFKKEMMVRQQFL